MKSIFDEYREKDGNFINFIEDPKNYPEVNYDKFIKAPEYNKYIIEFKPTANCNFNCSYCNFHSNRPSLKDGLFDKYLNYIDNFLKDKYDEILVFIQGGEPQLYKNLSNDLLKFNDRYKEKYKIKYLLQTNGFGWSIDQYKNNLELLKSLNLEISISYHHNFTKISSVITRIHLIEKFNKFGVLTYLLSESNIKEDLKILKLLKAFKIPVHIRAVIQDSNFINKNYKELLSIEESNDASALLVKDNISTKMSFEELTLNKINNFCGWKCQSGITGIVLDHAGIIYRCNVEALHDKNRLYDANKDIHYPNSGLCDINFCSMYMTDKEKV